MIAGPVLNDEGLVISTTNGLFVTPLIRIFDVGFGVRIRPLDVALTLVLGDSRMASTCCIVYSPLSSNYNYFFSIENMVKIGIII